MAMISSIKASSNSYFAALNPTRCGMLVCVAVALGSHVVGDLWLWRLIGEDPQWVWRLLCGVWVIGVGSGEIGVLVVVAAVMLGRWGKKRKRLKELTGSEEKVISKSPSSDMESARARLVSCLGASLRWNSVIGIGLLLAVCLLVILHAIVVTFDEYLSENSVNWLYRSYRKEDDEIARCAFPVVSGIVHTIGMVGWLFLLAIGNYVTSKRIISVSMKKRILRLSIGVLAFGILTVLCRLAQIITAILLSPWYIGDILKFFSFFFELVYFDICIVGYVFLPLRDCIKSKKWDLHFKSLQKELDIEEKLQKRKSIEVCSRGLDTLPDEKRSLDAKSSLLSPSKSIKQSSQKRTSDEDEPVKMKLQPEGSHDKPTLRLPKRSSDVDSKSDSDPWVSGEDEPVKIQLQPEGNRDTKGSHNKPTPRLPSSDIDSKSDSDPWVSGEDEPVKIQLQPEGNHVKPTLRLPKRSSDVDSKSDSDPWVSDEDDKPLKMHIEGSENHDKPMLRLPKRNSDIDSKSDSDPWVSDEEISEDPIELDDININ